MPQEFQAGLDIANVYAQALFELADASDTVAAVYAELADLVALLDGDVQIAEFCRADNIDTHDRARSLERVFRGRLSDLLLNTLQVMNLHGRLGLLPQLRRALELRIEHDRDQVEVTATSAVALTPAQQAEIQRVAAQLSGQQPLVAYVVDPRVIGGLILQIGDYRFDNSVRQHLQATRQRLLDRSSRGLDFPRLEEP